MIEPQYKDNNATKNDDRTHDRMAINEIIAPSTLAILGIRTDARKTCRRDFQVDLWRLRRW
jgi:hypothetical protein